MLKYSAYDVHCTNACVCVMLLYTTPLVVFYVREMEWNMWLDLWVTCIVYIPGMIYYCCHYHFLCYYVTGWLCVLIDHLEVCKWTRKKLPESLNFVHIVALTLIHAKYLLTVRVASSSRMRVINHNWSATKQRLHLQSVSEISRHSVLSGDRIRQCETSSGSRHKDTDQCL